MPINMPREKKGAARHDNAPPVGAEPYVTRDPLVECPRCQDDPLVPCDGCDGTGRVTPERADILRRQRDAKHTDQIG